jgi:hypothetical protein
MARTQFKLDRLQPTVGSKKRWVRERRRMRRKRRI